MEVGGPGSHTRTLILDEYVLELWIDPNFHFPGLPLSTLASFTYVRSLTFFEWKPPLFNGASLEPYFGHFGKSLRALSPQMCTLDPATLFDLLSLLPKVEDLEISYPLPSSPAPDIIPDIPAVTPSFCGALLVVDPGEGSLLLKALATLPLHFSIVRIYGGAYHDPEPCQMLLTSCRDTMVTIIFWPSFRGALRHCPGLNQSVHFPNFPLHPSQIYH
jgi:hypothetical protein